MRLRITVRTLAGDETDINANGDDTVDTLKEKVEMIKGIPATKQILVSLGHQMMPGHRLKDYDLSKVFVIGELAERPPGKLPGGLRVAAANRRLRKLLPRMPEQPPPSRLPAAEAPRRAGEEGQAELPRAAAPEVPPPPAHEALPEVVVRGPPYVGARASVPTPGRGGDGAVRPPQLQPQPLAPRWQTARACEAGQPVACYPSGPSSLSWSPPTSLPQDPPAPAPAPAVAAAARSGAGGAGASAPPVPPPASRDAAGAGRAPGTATPQAAALAAVASVARAGGPPPAAARARAAPAQASHSHAPSAVVSCAGSPPAAAHDRGRATESAGGTCSSLAAASCHPSLPSHRVRRGDLQRIGRLGVGAFGVVTLEADRRNGRTYALKAVSKGYLVQLRMEYSVLNEKRILKMVDSPFVVRLVATYNGREHVYFLLEAALGGELFTTYERLQIYGSEKHAKFYVGCVAEALAHLHERHVIYRDLKPENLLLDARGYCKLTDLGLAKISHDKTYTLVGTPDYMAPEVLAQTGHGKAVDWWMLGVLLFELLAGRAPFEAPTTNQVYDLIKRGIESVRFPEKCPSLARELVRALCRHIPEQRLRMPMLRENPWFRGFDWSALRALRFPAPHVPCVRGPRDLANFRQCEGEEPPATPYHDTGSGWDAGFEDDALGEKRALSLNPAGPGVRGHEDARGEAGEGGNARSLVVYSPRPTATELRSPGPMGAAVAAASRSPTSLMAYAVNKAFNSSHRASVSPHENPTSPALGGS